MGYFDKLTAEKQVSYLIKPILEVLNQASTPLKTAEIRAEIIQLDTKIAEFANTEYTSKCKWYSKNVQKWWYKNVQF